MDGLDEYISLSEVSIKLNIDIEEIVNFLKESGIKIESEPTAKLSPEQYLLLKNHFNSPDNFLPTENIELKGPTILGKIELPTSSDNHKHFSNIEESANAKRKRKRKRIKKKSGSSHHFKIGQIKFFDHEKEYGFVKCWNDEQEYYIHSSNLESEYTYKNDYVIFELMPSREKKEASEACDLSLISEFTGDPDFLISQYLKYQNEYFRKEILTNLSDDYKLKLVECELGLFTRIENEEEFIEFSKSFQIYSFDHNKKILKRKISELIYTKIQRIADPIYQIRLWVDRIIEDLPEDINIQQCFKESTETERLLILKTVEKQTKIELIQLLIDKEDPERTLDFILIHLLRINGIDERLDVKSCLFNKKYWEDKKDYYLYTEAIKKIQNHFNEKQTFSLFSHGYLNSFSKEYVIANCNNLTQEEIGKILESEVLSKSDSFRLISPLLEKYLDSLWESINNHVEENTHTTIESKHNEIYQNQKETFSWMLQIAKKYLTENTYQKIELLVIEKTPEWFILLLWNDGLIENITDGFISYLLLTDEDIQWIIDRMIDIYDVSKDKIIGILQDNIKNLEEITNRQQFYILYNHLDALEKLEIESIEIHIAQNNFGFLQFANWIAGISTEFNFDEYKTKLVFLSPKHQIKFLKKLFWLSQSEEFVLTTSKLNELIRIDFDIFQLAERAHPDLLLDISVDIVIEAIKSFEENGKFLFDSDLLKIVLEDINLNKKYKFQIEELFEKCAGRFEARFNWNRYGEIRKKYFGNNQFYFAIQLNQGRSDYNRKIPEEIFNDLINKVKLIPGRKWNSEEEHWGVLSQYEEQVMQFARENRFYLGLEGSNYANNPHLAEFEKNDIPSGIMFCEGRLATNNHKWFNRPFWWCCNQPCFDNCETIHGSDNWEDYTLLDFMIIMGFNLDDGNRVGDIIERGKYYQFISIINRFNRLLERLYCERCENILYPIEESNYAHYRVTHFHCENQECSEYHREIYLHHCLNGKCKSIIDSRRSKKCPNGLYICSDVNCGCCCSHDMMSRRLENLQSTSSSTYKRLKANANNKAGHLERAMHFCYECGNLMEEFPNDIFLCNNCNIQYDVSKNNFKRSHRNLAENNENRPNIPPPPENEEDTLHY